MNKIKKFWSFLLISVVVCLFFYPVFKGQIPFPGDLLVSENPYNTQSYLGFPPGGYPNKAQGPDVINEIYPWRYFSISQVKGGSIPFWNPHNFSGNPQLANFQTGLFYPFNLLYLGLPFNLAWTIIIMLQPFLAAIFMYLFLCRGLSLSKQASIIGGIAFAFSSYMTVWIEYGNIGSTLLWLPFILLFVKRLYEKFSSLDFLILTLIISVSFLAGYIQGVFYIYVISFLYFLFLFFRDKKRTLKHKRNFLFAVSLIFPIALTFFQLYPTLVLFSDSTRGAYTLGQISKMLAPFYYWITAFVPDFFGNPATRNYWYNGTYIETVMYAGVGILFFAIYSVFKSKNPEKFFFSVLAFLSLIIASNLPGIKFLYLLPIPMVSTTVPTRELNIFIFSVIILGALGIDNWLKEKNYKSLFPVFFVIFYALIWGVVFLLPKFIAIDPSNISVTKHNLILPTVLAFGILVAFYLKRVNKNLAFIIVLLLVSFDLFYFFNKITPFSPAQLTYPNTPIISYIKETAGINRFWGYGSGYIPANYQSVDGTYSPEGNDPLHIAAYTELLASSKTGTLPEVLPRPDANIAPGYGPDDLKNNGFRQTVLNLLGVKYVLQKQQLLGAWEQPDLTTFPEKEYSLVYKVYPWQVYENKNALPRFFLANNFKVENRSHILSSIYSGIDLRKTLLLEKSPGIKIDKNSKGGVRLLSYTANEVSFSVKTNGNSLLFLSDNYYPEWSAYVDGVKTNLLRADYSFRAVAVPKGEHNVVFSYDPVSFVRGIALSGASLGLLLIIFFITRFYEKKK